MQAPSRRLTEKILEAFFMALLKLYVYDQIDPDLRHLFKKGIT